MRNETLHLFFPFPLLSLFPQEWPYVHGKIDRTEAEKRLKGCGKIGAFLVRAISTKSIFSGRCKIFISHPPHCNYVAEGHLLEAGLAFRTGKSTPQQRCARGGRAESRFGADCIRHTLKHARARA